MSSTLSSFAVLSGSALVLLLSGCSGSLPKTLPEAVPSTAPDTLTALQAQQSSSPSRSGVSASQSPRQASLAQSAANPKASPTSAASEASAPSRAPASVMRVWVAPWEDADGTLHGANHLFIEVLPRRWQLEGAVLPAAGVLQPLQLVERSQPDQPHNRR